MREKLKLFVNNTKFYHHPTADLSNFTSEKLTDVLTFHKTIPSYKPTPLYQLPALANYLGIRNIFVKDESQRFDLKAFKVLGGSFAMAKYIANELGEDISKLPFDRITSDQILNTIPTVTFATTTDGNHGRGVAWTAKQLKQKSVVYMPKGSSQERLEAIQNEGAKASITDLNYDDAVRMTAKQAKKHKWVVIQDTAWSGYEDIPLWIMQGYCTLMLEIKDQLKKTVPTHIFIQAGVGSLAAAVQAMVINMYGDNAPKVVIVEADSADCFYRSVKSKTGKAQPVGGNLFTVMAGLACGEANSISWPIIRDYSLGFASCPNFVSTRGMRILANPLASDPRIISGESGAVTTGLLSILMESDKYQKTREELGLDKNSLVLVVSTEGNTDPQRYLDIVWDGEYPSLNKF